MTDNPVNQQLLQAAAYGKLDEVVRLLAGGADVNTRDQYGDSALNQAARTSTPATSTATRR